MNHGTDLSDQSKKCTVWDLNCITGNVPMGGRKTVPWACLEQRWVESWRHHDLWRGELGCSCAWSGVQEGCISESPHHWPLQNLLATQSLNVACPGSALSLSLVLHTCPESAFARCVSRWYHCWDVQRRTASDYQVPSLHKTVRISVVPCSLCPLQINPGVSLNLVYVKDCKTANISVVYCSEVAMSPCEHTCNISSCG